MKFTNRDIIVWAPRVVGLGLAAFLSLFATDAFTADSGVVTKIVGFAMGLVPAALVLTAVGLGWNHQRLGAMIFIGLAGLYAAAAIEHPGWIVTIAGPLVLVGALFFLSWRVQTRDRQAA